MGKRDLDDHHDVGGHEGPIAEFGALRQEIGDLVRTQLQILVLQLTVSGAVFGFVLSGPARAGLLLVLPISSYLLCGRFVSQHFGTIVAGYYINVHLSPRVPGGLGWEAWLNDTDLSRRFGIPRRLWVSTLPLMLSFPGTGALALCWAFGAVLWPLDATWSLSKVGLCAVWLVGAAAVGVSTRLLVQMTRTRRLQAQYHHGDDEP